MIVPLLLLSTCLATAQGASKHLNVVLQTSWHTTPLLSEASEYLCEKSSSVFWRFVRATVAEHRALDWESGAEQYAWARDIAARFLSRNELTLLDFGLGLRVYSPRIESSRQLLNATVNWTDVVQRDCVAVALVNDRMACNVEELKVLLKSANENELEIFDFDHVYSRSSNEQKATVILYAEIGTKQFNDFFTFLVTESKVNFVLRHFDGPNYVNKEKIALGGFGVELSLKSVEYKAEDDSKVDADAGTDSAESDNDEQDEELFGLNFPVLHKRKPEHSEALKKLQQYMQSVQTKFEDLKVWQMQSLGIQAAQRIAESSEPLALLREIAQDFPSYATAVSRVRVNETFKQELDAMHNFVMPQANHIIVNGRALNPEKIDAFKLFNVVRAEVKKASAFEELHISSTDAAKLAALDISKTPAIRFNVPLTDAMVLNDLETDRMYRSWPKSLTSFQRFTPSWQQQFPMTRRNMFTTVFVLDPASAEGVYTLAILQRIKMQRIPMRLAVILQTEGTRNEEMSKAAARLWLAVAADMTDEKMPKSLETGDLTWPGQLGLLDASTLFGALTQTSQGSSLKDVDALKSAMRMVDPNFDVDDGVRGGDSAAQRKVINQILARQNYRAQLLGIDAQQSPVAFVNGALVTGEDLANNVLRTMMETYPELQEMIKNKELTEEHDIYERLTTHREDYPVFDRYNAHVQPSTERPLRFVHLADSADGPVSKALSDVFYLTNPKFEFETKSITHLLVQDLETAVGQATLTAAIERVLETENSRVGILFCGKDTSKLGRALRATFAECSGMEQCVHAAHLLAGRSAYVDLNKPKKVAKFVGASDVDAFVKHWKADKTFVASEWCRELPSNAIITNGRIIEMDDDTSGSFVEAAAFAFLEAFENRYKPVLTALEQVEFVDVSADEQNSRFMSDLVMRLVSVLGVDLVDGVKKIVLPEDLPTHVDVNQEKCMLSVVAVLDPLSRAAQRSAPLLEALSKGLSGCVKLSLNPNFKITELPLKTYYRFVLPTQPHFANQPRLAATFAHLPADRLLTLALDHPDSWLAEPVVSPYDLDNIRLSNLPPEHNTMHASFELNHILVEGNCADQSAGGKPPRGLQLMLGTEKSPHAVDTLVMSNLGYFQLKSRPGVWQLRLVDGKGSELYHIGEETEQTALPVVVRGLDGAFVKLKVTRRKGKEGIELLGEAGEDEEQEENDMMARLRRMMRGEEPKPEEDVEAKKARRAKIAAELKEKAKNGTIHVFSVATGHLYERFMRIMMLSVMRNTKNPVKFWLLSNFMSPKFRDFLPHMAKHYGFEYELVTYKWPAWLNGQTEKQRVIWGYKILFLDVLFPVDVPRIIYVDADQIVRADLKELMELDLEGAPYGYTPFCNDRPEMDGFRFWKQGYWEGHLQGKPYHISALYVVDLEVFRRQGAGDQLRATYDSLSQDPNSLANLDQDLPNYLQHQVRIHSLPQSWLWCETWCSDESKTNAKTIDLCNNPLTKTPKLDNAIRIVTEWTDYDLEVKSLESDFATVLSGGTLKDDEDVVVDTEKTTKKEPKKKVIEHTEL